MHIHILGICGTFMGGLALIARAAGHTVTGCDEGVYPPMSTQLAQQGIDLIQGFGIEQLALKPDLFIIGNVVSRGNPLMEAILNQRLPYTSGPQWLGEHILQTQHVLAVAGTHGKTTTSAMLAWILNYAGLDPNFLIGGVASNLLVSARYQPNSSLFVIEADEYDTAFFDKRSKFVHYRPHTTILNNLEFDHADIFSDLTAIETQFHHLIRTIAQNGLIIRPQHSDALDRVCARGLWTPVQTLGPQGHWHIANNDTQAFPILYRASNTPDSAWQEAGWIHWSLNGKHNQANALAAIAAASHVGVEPALAIQALNQFQGVKRRMELRGTVGSIRVFDDFAHHPTAIALTLDGLRKQADTQRIIAVFEPRSNTMKLGQMAERLPSALAQADQVFCYAETQGKHTLGWDPETVFRPLGQRAKNFTDLTQLIDAVVQFSQAGDTIVVMSNGSFGGIHDKLLKQLSLHHKVPQ